MDERLEKLDKLINEALDLVNPLASISNDSVYPLIAAQLIDMKENVVQLGIPFDQDEINQRYSLGALATKNLDPSDPLYRKIVDIFYLASHINEVD